MSLIAAIAWIWVALSVGFVAGCVWAGSRWPRDDRE